MKFINRLTAFFILTVLLVPSLLAAQTQEYGTDILNEDGMTQRPDLSIDYIQFPSSNVSFFPGDQVEGTFTLYNTGVEVATDVEYLVHIVTLAEEGGIFYPIDSLAQAERSEVFSLPSGKRDLPFSVTLPSVLPTNLQIGVFVEAFLNDMLDASEHVPIRVINDGESGLYVDIIDARLDINGEETYRPAEGPYIGKEEQVEAVITMSNDNDAATEVVPVMKIYGGANVTNDIIYENQRNETISLDAGQETDYAVAIPTFLDPGVYTAIVNLENTAGQVVGPRVEYRFIVEGLKPRVEAVSFNEIDQRVIDQFEVHVEYSDIPFNSRRDATGNYIDPRAEQIFSEDSGGGLLVLDNLFAQVIIKDATTGEVITSSDKQQFIDSFIDFTFDPISASNKLLIEIPLEHNGEVVDIYTSEVDIIPAPKDLAWWEKIIANPLYLIGGLLAVLLLVIAGMVVGVTKSRAHKREVMTSAGSTNNSFTNTEK